MCDMQIYLAGPSFFLEDEGREWRNKATQILHQTTENRDVKVRVMNPIDFFSYSEARHQSDTQVKRYYMDQIAHSRLVLVNLDQTRTSPGTAQELQYASDHDIPIVGFGGEEVYPWLKADCQCVFPSMLQAIDYIVEYYM